MNSCDCHCSDCWHISFFFWTIAFIVLTLVRRRKRTSKISRTRTWVRYTFAIINYSVTVTTGISTQSFRQCCVEWGLACLRTVHWKTCISVDGESSGSSDETNGRSGVNVSTTTSNSKMKSSSGKWWGKKKKIFVHKLSFSIDRATSLAEEVATKINIMMASNEQTLALPAQNSCWR